MAGKLFDPLLDRSAFRADLLYFIRLAGNYAAHIFIDVRSRAPSKHRKQMAEWLENDTPVKDKHFQSELVKNAPRFDALKADFTTVLEKMPDPMRTRLAGALQYDHALPLDLGNFTRALDDLREYRHYLEHYDERKRQGRSCPVTDERVLDILGLILLPFLNAHMLGRMRHHGRRLRLRDLDLRYNEAKKHIDAAQTKKRDASKFINGLKKRVDHDSIRDMLTRKYDDPPGEQAVHRIAKEEAKKRRDLEQRKASLLELHRDFFREHTWPRYNLENFLIRFGFIGKGRIQELEKLLGSYGEDEAEQRDFINDIEPLFMLSMDIGLVIHSWLAELEEEGVPLKKTKKIGKTVISIRNTIAHGGWVWDVKDTARNKEIMTLAEILKELSALPERFSIPDAQNWRNQLFTRMEATIQPCKWHRVYAITRPGDDPNQIPAHYVVKRWTVEKRESFSDRTRWRVERRTALRRVASAWMREIATARSHIKSKKS
ncbi:MAG: hypothetical protein ACK5NN_07560 [Sphingomonadaceae bacterium]